MKYVLLVLIYSFNMNGGDIPTATTAVFDDKAACDKALLAFEAMGTTRRSTPFTVRGQCVPKASEPERK